MEILSKTLEDLEGKLNRGDADESSLAARCHALWRKQIDEFTVENLRLMIGQQLGLRYLIPLALERLKEDPWTAGDMYEGDLLAAVARSSEGFWLLPANRMHRINAVDLVKRALDSVGDRTVSEETIETFRLFAESYQ